VRVPEGKGELAALTGEIARLGGNIISLVTFWGDDPSQRVITFKVQEVKREELVPALEKGGVQIIDVREVGAEYQPKLISSR
jgi:acetoin utilization protein AcuB